MPDFPTKSETLIVRNHILLSNIEFLKGVGPKRALLLQQELGIHTFADLLFDFPFRYIDKTTFHQIRDITEDGSTVQLKGVLTDLRTIGVGRKKRMSGKLRDETGTIQLIWFKGFQWIENLVVGNEYILYGKVNLFKGTATMAHPEFEKTGSQQKPVRFEPVYRSTEKLNQAGLDSRNRAKLVAHLLERLRGDLIPETLPGYLLQKTKMMDRQEALEYIHYPPDQERLDRASFRLKFEELFFSQLRLLYLKQQRTLATAGYAFLVVGDHLNDFYRQKLPFELTNAQKRVIKEIRKDLGSGYQMNRLLQGDVGSGKTMVALMCMLIALDNGYQSCLLAPTEILASQHYRSLSNLTQGLGIRIAYLSGSVKGNQRKETLRWLHAGEIHIIVGTHALLEDPVRFQRLGLCIIDEQHRFGVEQRSRLWQKASPHPPHVLVMTATPIPRTLAMTLYGDLDVSVIDELPPGRKEIKTLHRTEATRPQVIEFLRMQIEAGRQIYVVYPLIEESEKLDLQNLQTGYEALLQHFPRPKYQMSIVHGRMKPEDKEFEMKRFIDRKTQILVSTTVIEVGVDVPNASVMVIENTERFGLSQLHQLRGRVGRGGEQSYCLLMTGFNLSAEAKKRIDIMVRTNNGFEIAEADLELRGPGDIEGTRQSGQMEFAIADLGKDGKILQAARALAKAILTKDPQLQSEFNAPLRYYLDHIADQITWSKIA